MSEDQLLLDDAPHIDLDFDIQAFLTELTGNEGIQDEESNIDVVLGAQDIDTAIDNMFTDSDDVSPLGMPDNAQDISVVGGAAKRTPQADTAETNGNMPESEPAGSAQRFLGEDSTIDPAITPGDMMTILYAEIARKRIAGHHIDTMNHFNQIGVKQIVTKVFSVEGRLRNERDKNDEDRDITEIAYKVEFKDVNLTSPTTRRYKTGTTEMLTPNMARIKDGTYSCQTFMDATITAIAYLKNGTTKTRTAEIKSHRIAATPCMIGTEMCNTFNCSKEALKEMEEDPHSPGGFFIIKGHEWTIDNLENIANNEFHVYKNAYMNEIARGNFLSKPGDAFENSYQVILRYLNSGAITLEITTNKVDKFEIPFYLIFRALGMTSDRDICDHIVYGVDNTDPATLQMLGILQHAFTVSADRYKPIQDSVDPAHIITFLGQRLAEGANPGAARKDDNIAKYLNTNVLNIIDRYVFPHIGTDTTHRISKLWFLGHLINRLLCVFMGVTEPTNRDDYGQKRLYAAGTSIAKAYKTDFNIAVVQEIKRHLVRDFRSTPFSNVQLAESVKSAINADDLERLLIHAITTGNKVITVKRNEVTNRVSSQTVFHKNDLNFKSTLNAVNAPNTTASKRNERADEMRRVHPTYLGFIDVSQSADTGEKVGMTKQLACSASICGASSSFVLKAIVLADEDILPRDSVTPAQVSREKLAKVFVNGDMIGFCRESHNLVRKYRMMRRRDEIHYETTIVWDLLRRAVYFLVDLGRLKRPLVIVYNNIEEYVENWRHGDRTTKFRQWIRLTRAHIVGLQNGSVTMDDLRTDGIIEYITVREQENTFLSPSITDLREHADDLTHMYTHVDIEQAIFGMLTLASPMANHSSATRITYYTNHRKQSAGWYVLNYPFRIDKNVTLQHYCDRPLISAFSDVLTYPNGQNILIAAAMHTGYNCEDSIIINQSSVDCGMFNASFYTHENAELDKDEQFGNVDMVRTLDIKRNASYEHATNGFVAERTIVNKGDVLIVKSEKISKPVDQFLYVDKSVVYKREEPAFVERVISTQNDDGAPIAKVKLRVDRPLGVGDKLSSKSGNKGIVAYTRPRCDMPYCEDGTVPDAIVNPHSFPTRMAISQIIEGVLGLLAVRRGTHIDGTVFREIDIDGAVEALETEHGIKYGGHRRMYNGRTGEWIDTLIFMVPNTYMRLQKFVIDEQYAIRSGPTSALTHQPLDGKNNDGGLRLGEMEAWVYCSHGVMRAMCEKFYDHSDGMDIHVCRGCGNRAIVNERMGIYKCRTCGDNADITRVQSSWAANLFFNETGAMNVNMKFDMSPHEYLEAP